VKNKSFITCALLAGMVILLTSCVPGGGAYTPESPAGFFWGLWHGFIALITLIGSLFSDYVNIYEVHNTGLGYNIGFLIGVNSLLGGGIFRSKLRD